MFDFLTGMIKGTPLGNLMGAGTSSALKSTALNDNPLLRAELARANENLGMRPEMGAAPNPLEQASKAESERRAGLLALAKQGGIMGTQVQPLGLLQQGAAPGAAQMPQQNIAAPMASMMQPTQNPYLGIIQERLNKMIGGYYG